MTTVVHHALDEPLQRDVSARLGSLQRFKGCWVQHVALGRDLPLPDGVTPKVADYFRRTMARATTSTWRSTGSWRTPSCRFSTTRPAGRSARPPGCSWWAQASSALLLSFYTTNPQEADLTVFIDNVQLLKLRPPAPPPPQPPLSPPPS